jgi:hypothetical protein
MAYLLLQKKVLLIDKVLKGWQLKSLERVFDNFSKNFLDGTYGTMAGRGYLFIEVLYALLRHREWLDVPVLKALSVEFLQLDHRLPRRTAMTLVDQLILELKRLGVSMVRTVCADDREFLVYCYVSAAGLNGDLELEMELGLGSAIVAKLRDGIELVDEGEFDAFVPEYDAMLASVFVELGFQSKACPYALDIHRLKYRLLSALGDASLPYILEEKLPSLLESLVDVGRDQVSCDKNVEIMSAFEQANLVIASRDGRGRINGWELSSDGASLSAGLFMSKYYSSLTSSPDIFLAYCLEWQMTLIKEPTLCSISFVMDLLSGHISRMPPVVIEAAVSRLISVDDAALDPESLKHLLRSAKLPWHKAAIFRALANASPSDELASVVADSLSFDVTHSMAEAAGALLEKWGRNHLPAHEVID